MDPLSKYGPDHVANTNRIKDKLELIDTTFLTTDPNSIATNLPNSYFIPNPSDKSFEILGRGFD